MRKYCKFIKIYCFLFDDEIKVSIHDTKGHVCNSNIVMQKKRFKFFSSKFARYGCNAFIRKDDCWIMVVPLKVYNVLESLNPCTVDDTNIKNSVFLNMLKNESIHILNNILSKTIYFDNRQK
jgi:hypothetical protein